MSKDKELFDVDEKMNNEATAKDVVADKATIEESSVKDEDIFDNPPADEPKQSKSTIGKAGKTFNPLTDFDRVDRDYTKKFESKSTGVPEPDIPEPVYKDAYALPDDDALDENLDGAPNGKTGGEAQDAAFANPAMNDLSNKQKKEAAEYAVDTILTLYEKLNEAVRKKVPLPIDKIIALHEEGLLNKDMLVPFQNEFGQVENISFIKSIEIMNEQQQAVFVVSEEFKENVREPMIREFMAAGIGLTDRQKIAVEIIIDILGKAIAYVSIKYNQRAILEQQKQIHQEMLKQGRGDDNSAMTGNPVNDEAEYVEVEEV